MTTSSIAWTDLDRASAFSAWLASITSAHRLHPQTVQLASADASFRRYFRVQSDAGTCIIMDAPPAQENCEPFVHVAGLMAEAGLSAPQVLAWDRALGFLLLTDLGVQTMLDVIEQKPGEQAVHALYVQAVQALIQWQLASRPEVLPPYDEALLSRELALFPQWYVAQHRGFTLDAAALEQLHAMFERIVAHNLQSLNAAKVYVHRDFMPRNLMVSNKGLGILDFQDAVYGPITYDIASLMRDAFLSWPEDFVLDITVRYWEQARKAGLPVGDDFGQFYSAVEWMGLQRHLKVLGIFARLTLRDGKPKYLADTPRFIGYVRATANRYRELSPLLKLLDKIEDQQAHVAYTF